MNSIKDISREDILDLLPYTRKFCECKLCKRVGISNKYWIRNWEGWNLNESKNS